MWWLLVPAALGAAKLVHSVFAEDEKAAKQRVKSQRRALKAASEKKRICQEKIEIEKLANYQFGILTDLYHASARVSETAQKLFNNAEASLGAVDVMIEDTRKRCDQIDLEMAHVRGRNRGENFEVEKNIVENALFNLIQRRDDLKLQSDELHIELIKQNAKTKERRTAVRERCGQRGAAWHAQLKQGGLKP